MIRRFGTIAVLTVLTVVALSLWRSPAPARAGDGRDALALMPQNTALVIAFDLAHTRKSANGRALLDAAVQARPFTELGDELLARAGLDLRRSIETVVMGMADDYDTSHDLVVLARGSFVPEQIAAAAKKRAKSFAKRRYRGLSYYVINRETAMAFTRGYALVAPENTMPKIIDVATGKARSAQSNRALRELIGGGDTKKDMWAAFVIPDPLRREISRETGGSSVEAVMASADLERGLAVRVQLHVSSREGAAAIASLVRQSAKQAGKDRDVVALGVARALAGTQVKQSDERVDIAVALSQAELAGVQRALEVLERRTD